MQPYFFPYLGYYQLAAHVDHFIFLDDVKMIKRGYIQRNHILLHETPYRFTLPIQKSSQNKNINQHFFTDEHEHFLKILHSAYQSAPYFKEINELIQKILKKNSNVAECCKSSIIEVFSYIKQSISHSSSSAFPSHLKSQDRIIDFCKKFEATQYCNPIGGQALYDSIEFNKNGINLCFFDGEYPSYRQNNLSPKKTFIPKLSMIDILMNNSKEEISHMLKMGIIKKT